MYIHLEFSLRPIDSLRILLLIPPYGVHPLDAGIHRITPTFNEIGLTLAPGGAIFSLTLIVPHYSFVAL